MLSSCHGRMRNQCATLLRIRAHAATEGADSAAASAARAVIRFFDTAARDHHEDEEKDLFPALIESMAGSDPICVRELIDSLTSEHLELERLWSTVRPWLAAVETRGAVLPEAAEIDSFVELHERHAAREDRELLPMAERLLGTNELEQIGRSMRRRRGIGDEQG